MFVTFSIFFLIVSSLNAQQHWFTSPENEGARPVLKIIGGNEAFPHSLGYQIGIRIEQTDGYVSFCGGSLITSSYVLSAAHCLQRVYSLEIILGAHNITKNEWSQIRMRTVNYTIHPEWDPEYMVNDIALIKLPKPVKTSWIIRTVALPKDDKDDYAGVKGIVSGWGITKYNDTMSDVLVYATSTILSNTDCKKIHPFDEVIQKTHLCLASREKISSCSGDSGGPLVTKGMQVGIVSFNVKNCDLKKPSVFTRVSKYLKWIYKNTDLWHI